MAPESSRTRRHCARTIHGLWWAVLPAGHRQPVCVCPSRTAAESFRDLARIDDAEILPVDIGLVLPGRVG